MLPSLPLPNVRSLIEERHIKLYLKDCKLIKAQSGSIMLVSLTFGAGYYGRFRGVEFIPSRDCTSEYITQLKDVETRGLEAVKEIGILTGRCCVCGRTLTAEDSINGGIGPICAGKAFSVPFRKPTPAVKFWNTALFDLEG